VVQSAVVGLGPPEDSAFVECLNTEYYREITNEEEEAFFPNNITTIYENREDRLKSISGSS